MEERKEMVDRAQIDFSQVNILYDIMRDTCICVQVMLVAQSFPTLGDP